MIALIRENIAIGRIHKKVKALNKPEILFIDEVDYTAIYDDVAHYFFQIVTNCYENG